MNYWGLAHSIFRYIDKNRRKSIFLAMLAQSSLALLDVAGIGLFGLLTYTLSTGELPGQITNVLFFQALSQFESAGLLLGFAIMFFMIKGLLAPIFFNFTSNQIAGSASNLSIRLTKSFFAQSLRVLDKDTSLENLYTVGVSALGVVNLGIGSILILSSELALLLLVISFLTVVNTTLALLTVLYFTLVLHFLQKYIAKKLNEKNALSIESNLKSANVFMDMFNNYRELTASQKFHLYEAEYEDFRTKESKSSMAVLLLNIIPKYVFEIAFFLGAGLIFTFLVATETSQIAIVQITVFIAGGSRILPSMLRIQGALSGLSTVENNLNRVENLERSKENSLPCCREIIKASTVLGQPIIEINELKFRYSNEGPWIVNIPNFRIIKGERVAIVGESGAGKSTFVDLILGVQEFQFGDLRIFLNAQADVIYVPQKLSLLNRSIAENIALGMNASEIDENTVRISLEKTGLLNFVDSLPNGIHTQVGERGVFLSGGQMQRIALSRAFYGSPEILILDEATSALDSISEEAITKSLTELPKNLTTIIIAHRLSTIKGADRVVYMKSGEIRGQGTFAEVRIQVKDFDHQAKLMGL
jgi:ABC-type multidrug transport system fused ATPase/permease subunit